MGILRSQRTCQQIDVNRCGKEIVASSLVRFVYFVEKQIRPYKFRLFGLLKHLRGVQLGKLRASCSAGSTLRAGDRVRIRSKREILATLDSRHRLRGLRFMNEMWKYCGQIHTVRKVVRRIVDENVYREKTLRGVVISPNFVNSFEDAYRIQKVCAAFN